MKITGFYLRICNQNSNGIRFDCFKPCQVRVIKYVTIYCKSRRETLKYTLYAHVYPLTFVYRVTTYYYKNSDFNALKISQKKKHLSLKNSGKCPKRKKTSEQNILFVIRKQQIGRSTKKKKTQTFEIGILVNLCKIVTVRSDM